MPKCGFNKVVLQSNFIEMTLWRGQSNFIEITLRRGCSPVNLLHIFGTPFPRNTSRRLLLKYPIIIYGQCFFLGKCLIRANKGTYFGISKNLC